MASGYCTGQLSHCLGGALTGSSEFQACANHLHGDWELCPGLGHMSDSEQGLPHLNPLRWVPSGKKMSVSEEGRESNLRWQTSIPHSPPQCATCLIEGKMGWGLQE